MNNDSTCWEHITEKEFRYWKVEIGKTHHIFSQENNNTNEVKYFIEDEGLNKIMILSCMKVYCGKYYYKNLNVIGS